MKTSRRKTWLVVLALVALASAGYWAWRQSTAGELPPGIAAGNGRLEATEIDIATKTAGRLAEILVNEGDFVTAGQVIARMDTRQLEAQIREAEAQLRRAAIGVETARSQVTQREAEQDAAKAVVAQREAEGAAADKKLARSESLAGRGNVSAQTLDDDRAAAESAKAAVAAARAQLAAAAAAIGAAKSAVIGAEADVEAARATIERLNADLADSALQAPRDGRIQYKVAQPGEVLAAGGRVANMVDLGDVYMTFFLPTEQAGRVALGTEVRLMLDAAPGVVVPARISFVADVAQFTPKTVETEEERLKLMFRIRARIAPELLIKYLRQVKTGLPGMAYVRLAEGAKWPDVVSGAPVE
ncbi:MAG: HlyD family efflux transporter periplasmic adaptor subunit [Zavarzinia sp.]|nr:HlyD family efflux transporter periplasmic adaptor subunit [Zavarzinia sp.]